MNIDKEPIKHFRTTLKQVIKNLSKLKDIDYSLFANKVEEAFDGYHYDGEDEVIGSNLWQDISKDGKYKLNAKVNHEDAYEFTIFVESTNGKITVLNIL